jgi:hypothetical protein
LRLFTLFLIVGALLSCSRSGDTSAPPPLDPAARLRAIPVAAPGKYRNSAKKDWQNPYLIIRSGSIGLVDLANHEIHVLKPDDVVAALANLPASAWPYGRVVAVEQNAGASERERADIRKNRALLAGTLESLKVAIYWMPSP